MKLALLLEAIAGVPGEGGNREYLFRLGSLLARELSAVTWEFHGRGGEGEALRFAGRGDGSQAPSAGVVITSCREPGGGESASSSLCIPFRAGPPCEGTFVLSFDPSSPPSLSGEEAGCVASAIGRASELARLRHDQKICEDTLDLFAALTRTLSGMKDPSLFAAALAGILRDHLGAVAGIIDFRPGRLTESPVQSLHVFPEHHAPILRQVALGERNEGEVEGILLAESVPSALSRLEIPLVCEGEDLGRILLWLPEGAGFLSGSIGRTCSELSAEVSLLVMNLLLHHRAKALLRERQKRLQEIWILQETNKALRGTLKLNTILKMILAGATVETGLGFNRAALFLLNERTGLLQGMLAVGPDSAEDADRIWKSLTRQGKIGLARQIELFAETQPEHSHFDRLVKGIRVPLEDGEGILAHAVRTRAPALIPSGKSDPPPERELQEKLSMTSFAVTPIMSRQQVFGVMVVDNFFDGKPVTGEDLRLLAMFADQAGLAIANAKALRAHQRAAEELRQARDQLVQTERLAVLGEVAANLAHEIRNPLVTIGGFARRLEKKFDPSDQSRRYASIIAGEAMRLEQFLEEVLLFGQDRKPDLGPVALNDIVSKTISLFNGSFSEAGITVRADLAADLPPVHGDPNQLRQIFVNLFANAVEAMADGGVLQVVTGADPGPPAALFATVSDTGGGVSPEVLGDIFSPFFTTKSSGHGLGLALTQRIVNAHSGRISVKNRFGTGLTFSISLPVFTAAAKAGRGASAAVRKGGQGK